VSNTQISSTVFLIVQTQIYDPESPDAAWQWLWQEAYASFHPAGRYAWHFAQGKLKHDPVFRALLEHRLIPPDAKLLDIGCGQALVASVLMAAQAFCTVQKAWPAAWGVAPTHVHYTGLECMAQDCQRAQALLAALPQRSKLRPGSQILQADMRHANLSQNCNVILLLDVLHYISYTDQELLLKRVHQALLPGGRLLIRVADARPGWRFSFSQLLDRCVARLRGLPSKANGGRSAQAWQTLLKRLGFEMNAIPMSQGTPFTNVLLVAIKKT
jgi:SAM-dependent methyltransferase